MSNTVDLPWQLLGLAKARGQQFDVPLPRQWYTALPAAAILLLCTVVVYRISLHPLAGFPGPFLAKFSGSWRNTRFWRGSWHDDVLELHRRYGPVVRVAPDELSVVDEQATKLLFGHGTKAFKTSWYNTWVVDHSREGFFPTQDKAAHAFLRKRVSAVYSMSAILRCEKYVQQLLDLMMERLEIHSEDSGVVNMSKWTDYLTFDVVGELGFGKSLGQLETESDTLNMGANVHAIFFLASNMGHYWGRMQWFTHPFVARINKVLGIKDPSAAVRNWTTNQIVDRRRKNDESVETRNDDMLAHFVKIKDKNGNLAEVEDVLTEGMNMIGAGADTTSVAMRACLYELCRSPEWYKRVQQEIDAYYEQQGLTTPITYQQTLDLPLLCAAIREAMRLLPSITYPLYRYAPPGMEVGSYRIPVGTSVGMSPGAANRNKSVWGDDADHFRPDRWLEDSEKAKYFNVNDMTFGGNGARACVGKNLALVEVHKFIAQLLRKFDIDFVDPAKPWRITSMWFAFQHDMHMKIRVRRK